MTEASASVGLLLATALIYNHASPMTIKRTSSSYSNVRGDRQFLWTLGLTYPALHDLNILHRPEKTAEATSKN